MAETPESSPFYTATNSRSEDTRDTPAPIDLIGALVQWNQQEVALDTPPESAVPFEDEEFDGIVIDMDAVEVDPDPLVSEEPTRVSDEELEFPIADADIFAPDSDDGLEPEPMEFDLSSLEKPVRDFARALRPVSIEELRRQIDAGILGNSRTDPFGDRLRHTIRQLVRGI